MLWYNFQLFIISDGSVFLFGLLFIAFHANVQPIRNKKKTNIVETEHRKKWKGKEKPIWIKKYPERESEQIVLSLMLFVFSKNDLVLFHIKYKLSVVPGGLSRNQNVILIAKLCLWFLFFLVLLPLTINTLYFESFCFFVLHKTHFNREA